MEIFPPPTNQKGHCVDDSYPIQNLSAYTNQTSHQMRLWSIWWHGPWEATLVRSWLPCYTMHLHIKVLKTCWQTLVQDPFDPKCNQNPGHAVSDLTLFLRSVMPNTTNSQLLMTNLFKVSNHMHQSTVGNKVAVNYTTKSKEYKEKYM